MATVRDIVTRAHRKIRVVAQDDGLSADEGQAGLDAFNEMLHAWALDGITLSPAFTDKTLDDTFPLADKFREGVVYLLASRLSPEYAAPADFDADGFFRKIQADYLEIATSPIDSALTHLGRTFRGYGANS